jgi:hypothetical protein
MAMRLVPFLVLLAAWGNGTLWSHPRPARVYYTAIVRKGPNWTPEQTPEIVRSGEEQRQYLENLSARVYWCLRGHLPTIVRLVASTYSGFPRKLRQKSVRVPKSRIPPLKPSRSRAL